MGIKRITCLITGAFLFINLLAQDKDHGYKLNQPDKDYGQAINIFSENMQTNMTALVFLPENYENNQKEYPVVYLLHGVNSQPLTEEGLRKMYHRGTRVLESADIYQVIIVAPIVGCSYYLDAPKKPANKYATFVGEELPAYMDKQYRTIKNRNKRILCGFSMGGYGAVSLLCRYPETFCLALSRGGVMNLATGVEDLDWDHASDHLQKLIGNYWNNREQYHLNSCFNLVNHIRNRNDIALVIEVGRDDFLYKTNYKFQERLTELNIPHIYNEHPGGHYFDSNCLMSLLSNMQYFVPTCYPKNQGDFTIP